MDFDWTAFSAIVALVLGLLSVWLGYLLPLHRAEQSARKATVSARYEIYQRPDTGRMQDRLIVVNHGPHAAEDVRVVSMADANGDPLPWENAMVSDYFPATALQPRQEHPAIFGWTMNDPRPAEVTVAWTDGDGRQERRFALGPMYV